MEQAHAETVDAIREAQLVFHTKSGERDVKAINDLDEVEEEDKWEQSASDMSSSSQCLHEHYWQNRQA